MMNSYGIVMGYYGPVWSLEALSDYAVFCKDFGYTYFIYAPKKDDSLRKNWAVPFTDKELDFLLKTKKAFEAQGVAFGVGFSPYGMNALDEENKHKLEQKIQQLNTVNPTILGVFFDDIEASSITPNVGCGQVAVAEFAASVSTAQNFFSVPAYYSHDQILQRVLGPTPKNYFAEFACLYQKFQIFWTGEHIISTGFTQPELACISDQLKRPVTLWHNYPVNDPPYLLDKLLMCAPIDVPSDILDYTGGVAFNPMVQPYVSMIPLACTSALLKQKIRNARGAYLDALHRVCGSELAEVIDQNLNYFLLNGMKRTKQSNLVRMSQIFSEFSKKKDLSGKVANDFLTFIHQYMEDLACV